MPVDRKEFQSFMRKGAKRKAHTAVNHNSAFAALSASNAAAKADSEPAQKPAPQKPAAKKARKPAPKRITKSSAKKTDKPKPAEEPVAKRKSRLVKKPETESWQTAGGEARNVSEDQKASKTLGIARISTWRIAKFQAAIEEIVGEGGRLATVRTVELAHGGESVTDVFATFETELAAEMIAEELNGTMVEGRRMKVVFA